jgi:hypothetical protein
MCVCVCVCALIIPGLGRCSDLPYSWPTGLVSAGGNGELPSRAERKAGKKAARKEAKKEGRRGFARKLQNLDVERVGLEVMRQLLPALTDAASPELVSLLRKGRQLVRWMDDAPLLVGTHTWKVWTQLVEGVLEVAGSGGAGCKEAQQLLEEVSYA